MTDEQLGKVAYEAHYKLLNPVHIITGPGWGKLTDRERESWVKVAQAVANELPPF